MTTDARRETRDGILERAGRALAEATPAPEAGRRDAAIAAALERAAAGLSEDGGTAGASAPENDDFEKKIQGKIAPARLGGVGAKRARRTGSRPERGGTGRNSTMRKKHLMALTASAATLAVAVVAVPWTSGPRDIGNLDTVSSTSRNETVSSEVVQPQVAPAPALTRSMPAGDMATSSLMAPRPGVPEAGRPQQRAPDFAESAAADVTSVSETPVSTFSIDVDTASYATTRAALRRGDLPPKDAVRIEEMVNYFDYDYAAPGREDGTPFAVHVDQMVTPWNAKTELLRIGIQGAEIAETARPPLDMVFLLDTSGSMNQPGKLPLLKASLRMALDQLGPQDRVGVVTYAGSSGVALEMTPASERAMILAAFDALRAGGGTNGQSGLETAYRLIGSDDEGGDPERIRRVVLATDGDFNIGLSDPEAMEAFIADKRESGAYLSVLGFGARGFSDATMQALAQAGNGTAAHIDTISEARKVLVEQFAAAAFPIADDVKIQVEFNPANVAEYRLIGYETRALDREDFKDDSVDAGEIGSGHSVTALYEITRPDSPARLIEPSRYEASAPEAAAGPDWALQGEDAFVRLRYKAPGEDDSQLIEIPVMRPDTAALEAPDAVTRWAAAIAGFGESLRGGRYVREGGMNAVIELALDARGEDPFGYRAEAIELMRIARDLR